MTRVSIAAMLVFVLIARSGSAGANDEPLEITLVNMTPGPVSAASRQCSDAIIRGIRRAGRESAMGINLRRLGETAARRTLGDGDFLGWESAAFDPLRDRVSATHTFVLFDCRPEDRAFRSLVIPTNPRSAVRAELHGLPIEPLFEWIVDDLLAYSWW